MFTLHISSVRSAEYTAFLQKDLNALNQSRHQPLWVFFEDMEKMQTVFESSKSVGPGRQSGLRIYNSYPPVLVLSPLCRRSRGSVALEMLPPLPSIIGAATQGGGLGVFLLPGVHLRICLSQPPQIHTGGKFREYWNTINWGHCGMGLCDLWWLIIFRITLLGTKQRKTKTTHTHTQTFIYSFTKLSLQN